MTRVDFMTRAGASGAVALIDGGQSWTFAAFDGAVSAQAARLAAARLAPGERVAVWAGKSLDAVATMFGVWRAGGVLVPVNPVLKPPQVAHILADSEAALCLSTPERLTQLEEAGALGAARPMELSGAVDGTFEAERAADDLAAILYTSGSTGRPKGVMLSHRNLWLAADSVATYLALTPDDRSLAVLPLSFDAGLSVVTAALHAGGAAVLLDYLLPRDVVRAVAAHRATTLSGVPPLFVQLAEVEWPEAARASLRRLTVTGGRMPAPLTRRYRAMLPGTDLYLMFGLTEAFRSLYLDPAEVDARPDSVGKAIPHAEVLIVRADGSPCDADEPGELVHCGPLVAQGYWRDPARTAERFRPAPPHAAHQGRAVWSGDTLRRDGLGFHFFVGRADEMIKTSGYRVSPSEVEEAALATGAVAEAVALGVPDARLGQAILLAVRAADGTGDAVATLTSGLRAALPSFMQPARVEWLGALPRNPNGKLDRAALRAVFAP